jgi:hypothetical protein
MYADHAGCRPDLRAGAVARWLIVPLVDNRFKLKDFRPRGSLPYTRWPNDQRTRSCALRNVSMHFFRPIRSSSDSGKNLEPAAPTDDIG